MLCYMDRTYCVSPGCVDKCGRKLTDKIRAEAVAWWGGEGAPIAMSDFCDDNGELRRAAVGGEGEERP